VKESGCQLCAPALSPAWVLSFQDGERSEVGMREALLALGNGYVGTRGAAPEVVADDVNYPGTYVAGFYNRLTSGGDGRAREDESLVNLPNWLPLTFRTPGGEWFGSRRRPGQALSRCCRRWTAASATAIPLRSMVWPTII
jgi:trehalose/maltose hydrolase-like predicted phosphorylase